MAASNKTKNYELNQWVGTDPVLMEDFNADNAKIDAALTAFAAGKLKFASGSYVGTGTYGKNAPCTLSFDFKPRFIIVQREEMDDLVNPTSISAMFFRPMAESHALMYSKDETKNVQDLFVNWTENGVSWWHTVTVSYAPYGANWQLNNDGITYHYAAFGF